MSSNKTEHDILLVNILTRTSNRPKGFNRLYQSVKLQTYKNIRHIVSYDNDDDKNYLNGLEVDLLRVESSDKVLIGSKNESGHKYAPYNLYCNDLLDMVNEGWVMFLDDDDNLYHNKFIEEIVNKIINKNNEDVLFVWQMRYPNGKVLPSNSLMDKEEILISNIGAPCFMFHSKYRKMALWDTFKGSDFRFLSQLIEIVPEKVFLKKVGIQINNFGDFGNRNDLSLIKKQKLPVYFYKNKIWYFIPKYHFEIFGLKIFHKSTYKKIKKAIFKKLKV